VSAPTATTDELSNAVRSILDKIMRMSSIARIVLNSQQDPADARADGDEFMLRGTDALNGWDPEDDRSETLRWILPGRVQWR
jgi:hypothetical protein